MADQGRGGETKRVLSGPSETVAIRFDTLRYLLHVFVVKVRRADDWVGPLGILATVTFTLLVSDFKDRLGLTGPQWQAVAGMTFLASLIWFLYAVIQRFRVPSTDSLLKEICANAIRRDEWRVLFFLKGNAQDRLERFLVFRDVVWDCFVLPHMRYAHDVPLELQEASFVHCIAAYLGLGTKQVSIRYMDGVDSTSVKHSERAHQETCYSFKFYSVVIQAEDQKEKALARNSFEIGGKEFSWLTLSEIERHSNTLKRNADILNHLTVNYDLFFNKAPNAIKRLIATDPEVGGGPHPHKDDRSMGAKT